MEKIEIDVNIPKLPGRTRVFLTIHQTKDAVAQIYDYTCIDCGYSTKDVDDMEWHQDNQRRYHTRFQRVKRAISVFLGLSYE